MKNYYLKFFYFFIFNNFSNHSIKRYRYTSTQKHGLFCIIGLLLVIFSSFVASAQNNPLKNRSTAQIIAQNKVKNVYNIKLDSTNNFVNYIFHNKLNYPQKSYEDTIKFLADTFEKSASFSNTKLLRGIDFSNTQFDGVCDFTNASFRCHVNFYETRFHGFVDFWNINANDTTNIDFYYANLPDLIDFSDNYQLPHLVDFSEANFDNSSLYQNHQWHYINLYQSDVSALRMDYTHFRLCFYMNDETDLVLKNKIIRPNDKMLLDGVLYGLKDKNLYSALLDNSIYREYLHDVFPSAGVTDSVSEIFTKYWLSIGNFPKRLDKDQKIAIYEKLLKNFDAQGQKISYQNLDIEYRNFKNGINVLPWIWYCYGYHKELIFAWTILFLIVFTSITFWLYPQLNKSNASGGVYLIKSLPSYDKFKDEKKHVKRNRLWYAFVYTSAMFFSLSLDIKSVNFSHPKKLLVSYIIVVYLVGLLCIGYLANFILQK